MKKKTILLVIAVAVGMTACSENRQKENKKPATEQTVTNEKENKKMNVKELTAAEFKNRVMNYEAHPNEWKFEGDKPAIIDFYATWCGPCKQMAPVVDEIAGDYEGKIDVYKVDVDQQQELAALFGVQSIPTLLFIPKDGQPQKAVGALMKSQFEQAIQDVLKVD